ncbi:hypothetical protein ACWDKQ_01465 [Saccharopolyspora sp. NPDC000995]
MIVDRTGTRHARAVQFWVLASVSSSAWMLSAPASGASSARRRTMCSTKT